MQVVSCPADSTNINNDNNGSLATAVMQQDHISQVKDGIFEKLPVSTSHSVTSNEPDDDGTIATMPTFDVQFGVDRLQSQSLLHMNTTPDNTTASLTDPITPHFPSLQTNNHNVPAATTEISSPPHT